MHLLASRQSCDLHVLSYVMSKAIYNGLPNLMRCFPLLQNSNLQRQWNGFPLLRISKG